MNRSLSVTLVLTTFILLSVSAFANSGELLNFQGFPDLQPVGNFYNGGGLSDTPNYGVTFSSNFYGLVSYANGGNGEYNPTILAYGQPIPIPAALFICPGGPLSGCGGTQTMGVMNVGPGFSNGLNFFYSAAFATGQTETVTVWSGANGTGTVLATISLANNTMSCVNTVTYCTWSNVGATFSGVAHSVTFNGPVDELGIAEITLGASGTSVPEPASFYLLGAGLVGISATRLRRFWPI
jgi:hypothetical protein